MLVRTRTDADLADLEQLVRAIHDSDGYPRFLPGDVARFIASSDSLGGWVAEDEDQRIVGHAALHRETPREALHLAADTLGCPIEDLAVIARVFVSPAVRRQGTGRMLLDSATREAWVRGLWPILDVVTDHHAAVALYDACGWIRVGEITVRFSDGNVLDEYVYVGPQPPVVGERIVR